MMKRFHTVSLSLEDLHTLEQVLEATAPGRRRWARWLRQNRGASIANLLRRFSAKRTREGLRALDHHFAHVDERRTGT